MDKHNTDVEFLQNIFKRFIPAVTVKDPLRNKYNKRPVFKGWLNVTEEQSLELAKHVDYLHGPFMYLTGKTTSLVAVDLDRKDISRNDHQNKTDGIEYWNNNFDNLDHLNTLIIKTPCGGRHLVYKYDERIKSGQLAQDVLIDILSDGKGMLFGPGYDIINRVIPTVAPPNLIQLIINNSNINLGQQQINIFNAAKDYSSVINKVINCNLSWDVIPSNDNKVFTLIPNTNLCTVDCIYVHSEYKHSRFAVTKTRVIAKCFSHNTERIVTGSSAKSLCELFFPSSTNKFQDFMNSLMEFCGNESYVRRDGFVWKAKLLSVLVIILSVLSQVHQQKAYVNFSFRVVQINFKIL